MSRRRDVPKRKILPDPIHRDKLVAKFTNTLMIGGKKSTAEGILYGSFEIIKSRFKEDPLEVFRKARQMEGPVFIQVITKKGQGCDFAEAEPTKFHGPGAYDPQTGEMKKSDGPPTFAAVFGKAMIELAKRDPEVVAITAAMSEGTGHSDVPLVSGLLL